MTKRFNKPVRLLAYAATFAVGIWGGNLLIKSIFDHSEGQQAAQAMLSFPAPEYQLPDMAGVMHSSREWDGKVVVLNFWATWCPPCRSETPTFVQLQEEFGSKGLQFVGVAIDEKTKVQDFMNTYGVNYPMLIGEQKAIEVAKRYGNRFGALPYTVIIDRQGKIQFVQRGELTRQTAEANIHRLL
jgi:thiol-disulfide isomerase/thioredoxin